MFRRRHSLFRKHTLIPALKMMLEIARNSETVLTLHGYRGMEEIVFVGGLFYEMRDRIRECLEHSGFKTAENEDFPGASPLNPCNRCRSARGVQLELTRGLRSAMFRDKSLRDCGNPTELFRLFTKAVRNVLSEYACRLSPASGRNDSE